MRCFVCGEFGTSAVDLELRKCSLGACGRFFHVSCAARLPLCNMGASGSFFRCPQHYCATCGKRCAGARRRGAGRLRGRARVWVCKTAIGSVAH
jgi:hypothetical protein